MPKANGVNEIAKVGALGDAPKVEIVSYHWKPGSQIKADPVQGYQALRALYTQHGAIKPEHVVEAARNVDSVLHDELEWDDTEAGKQYRDQQARHLLRSAVVVYRRPDQSLTPAVRAFVKLVPSADDPALDDIADDAVQPHVYLPIRQVMDEPDLRQRHKRQAFRELVNWRHRYRDISEFAAVFEQIDELARQPEFVRAI
jgi:hypothetical protein